MEKRLKDYLQKMAGIDIEALSAEEKEKLFEELMIQIGFFQHERLIHLIVTVTFAVLTVMAMIICLMMETPAGFLLPLAFLVLLVPYIRHYYILENGVQKLYTYVDSLMEYCLPRGNG
ncbi:MAG: hypothetical protein MJ114_03385 [Acetatifactor sp.]|nr:hypothetical protein [Acetatifactor sp.]